MGTIKKISPEEIAKDLRAHGLPTNAQKVRAMIERGFYPGRCYKSEKGRRVFECTEAEYLRFRDNVLMQDHA